MIGVAVAVLLASQAGEEPFLEQDVPVPAAVSRGEPYPPIPHPRYLYGSGGATDMLPAIYGGVAPGDPLMSQSFWSGTKPPEPRWPGKVDVPILLGPDFRSGLLELDVGYDWRRNRMRHCCEFAALQEEIKAVANLRYVSRNTPWLSTVRRPAIKIGSETAVSLADYPFTDRGDALVLLRKMLDPEWRMYACDKAVERYMADRAEYLERRKQIEDAFYAAHRKPFPWPGRRESRTVVDPVTGLECFLSPTLPKAPAAPVAPPIFDIETWDRPAEAVKPYRE